MHAPGEILSRVVIPKTACLGKLTIPDFQAARIARAGDSVEVVVHGLDLSSVPRLVVHGLDLSSVPRLVVHGLDLSSVPRCLELPLARARPQAYYVLHLDLCTLDLRSIP